MSDFNPKGKYHLVHRAADGTIISEEVIENLITNEGKNYILDAAFNTTALTTVSDVLYFTIFSGAFSPAVGSLYATPGGTENTNYTEGLRQVWGAGAAAGQSVTNGTAATITAASGGISVTGIGVVTSPTEQTGGVSGDIDFKGDVACSDGVIISEATVTKTLAQDETLDITYTINA